MLQDFLDTFATKQQVVEWMLLQQVATTSTLDAFQSWPCCHAKTIGGSELKHEASFRLTVGYH